MSIAKDHRKDRPQAMPSDFDSKAWLLVGITRTLAGWLALSDGCLAFADNDGVVHFSVPFEDIDRIWSPWYYFGGGVKISVGGQTFRITFTLPNDQPGGHSQSVGTVSQLSQGANAAQGALLKYGHIARGRESTRHWIRLLRAG